MVIIGALAVFVITLLLWPIGYFTRRHYGKPLNVPPTMKKSWLLSRLVCIADLIFVSAFMTIVLLSEKYFSLFSSRMDLWLHLLQILGWLGILGTLIILANAVASWRAKERGIWSKLGDTLIFVSAIGFSWFAIYWNLLRWSLHY